MCRWIQHRRDIISIPIEVLIPFRVVSVTIDF
jgi:hypothetical protein